MKRNEIGLTASEFVKAFHSFSLKRLRSRVAATHFTINIISVYVYLRIVPWVRYAPRERKGEGEGDEDAKTIA